MPSFQRSADPRQTRDLFVRRLARLIRLQAELKNDLNTVGTEMLDRAIYSTYRDCVDFGAERPARSLMDRYEALPRNGGVEA
jgi:hypothetical protein